ncbi:MAG: T9SS type A sorting domain-containing protein [Chitinophagales bacterium]
MADYITLESKDEILLKVSDTKGALLLEKTINHSTTIDVNDWDKGMYIFECFKDGQLIGLESVVKQ